MTKRLALHVGTAAALFGLGGSAAHAAPPETLAGISVQPGGSALLLHYEVNLGGLLYSKDGGRSFRVHPAMSFTYSGARAGTHTQILGNGTVLVGSTADGLFANGESACIKPADLASPGTAHAIALHPTDPNVAFIAMGSAGQHSGVVRRDADGKVTPLGPSDKTREVYDVRVVSRAASTAQLRIVTVATPISGAGLYLRYSDDLGQTWTERPISAASASASSVKLLGAKGGDPLVAVVGVSIGNASDADEVLLTEDDGMSFKPYVTDKVVALGQSVVAPDGRFFFADQGNGGEGAGGIWMAPQVGAAATKLASFRATCLAWDGANNGLFTCKPYELGRFDIASKSYCRMYKLNETLDFACPLTAIPTPDDWSSSPHKRGTDQMCDYWCGSLHFAMSPMCVADATLRPCTEKARAYDRDAMWEEPPTTQETACAVPVVDAGVIEVDAGADAGANADDAGSSESDAGSAGEQPGAKKSDDGCSVSSTHRGEPQALLVALLSMIGAAFTRRRVRR